MLPPLFVVDEALLDLARAMKDVEPASAAGDNPDVPAGFTYLGQFIDHDITLDLTPQEVQKEDPLATVNFRTPALDLDALYGPGPALAPYLYQRDPATGAMTPKLLVGKATTSPDAAGGTIPDLPNDLPRSSAGRAIIGDERNDENLLVAQTHLAMIKFHNKVVDWVAERSPGLSSGELFDEARRVTTWHYQWIVLFDFVERLTEPGLIRRIKDEGRRFYRFRSRPYMPVEFSAAGYRLGHSMVRETYDHNRVFNSGPVALAPGSLGLLFAFTAKSGSIIGDLAAQAPAGSFPPVGAQATLPSNWVIDWRRFYDFGGNPDGVTVNHSRRIDPLLVPALHQLPGAGSEKAGILAFLNLRRGVLLGLPSGQSVAAAMGVAPLDPQDIADSGPDGAAAAAHGLHEETPLWYYILKEAQLLRDGRALGPVGSIIVAETFLGLVHGDQRSFLWLRSNWKPELPRAEPDTFTMVDLLNFVSDINPTGDGGPTA
ncbi:peroxidase family protein [Rhodobacter sp. NSM]|uniref:peroxidase family protein n=1 Tax=Rhodobacter sp. NSM TaxID=3457501 RepID=UPI003FD227FA